jgi:hypothetical protein
LRAGYFRRLWHFDFVAGITGTLRLRFRSCTFVDQRHIGKCRVVPALRGAMFEV